jgi:hypothetical protein
MSAETAALIPELPLALLEARRIDVKGKGLMHTLLLQAGGAAEQAVLRCLGPPKAHEAG